MMDIEEAVAAYNDQRDHLATTRSKTYRKQKSIVLALFSLLVAVTLWLYFNGSETAVYIVPTLGGFLLLVFRSLMRMSADMPGRRLHQVAREKIFPVLFSDVEGLSFQANTEGFLGEIPDGIKPDFDECVWGDLIEGSLQGQPIAFSEVRLLKNKKGEDGGTVTVFKGLTLRIGLDEPVPDLIVSADRHTALRWISEKMGNREDMPQVTFDDKKFEGTYDVYCGNESFARSVFSAAERTAFIDLQSSLSELPMRLATTESTAYVLLSNEENFFELPALDRPFNTGTDGRRLQDEMQEILDLIKGIRDLLRKSA